MTLVIAVGRMENFLIKWNANFGVYLRLEIFQRPFLVCDFVI